MATSIQRSLIGANTEDSIAVEAMPIQPLLSQLHRVSEALEVIAAPLSAEQQGELHRIKNLNPDEKELIISSVEAVFDPLTAEVKIPKAVLHKSLRDLLHQSLDKAGELFMESHPAWKYRPTLR